jgi:radical SAM protein with 4Fe4S-binding SPASM domain
MKSINKLGFDIVHGCQLQCVGCPNSTLKPKIKRIAVTDFTKCLQNIDVNYIQLFRLFSFGKPLLHGDLPAILNAVKQQRWSTGLVEISTNAQYHDFEVLTEAFKIGVLNQLAVSCDGDGTPEEYERLRVLAKWEKLVTFLTKVREIRDQYSPRTSLVTRTICTSIVGQKRWRQLLIPLGWTPEFRDWLYLPESKQNMLNRSLKIKSGICSFLAPADRLYIDYDGTVVPCCVHPRAGILGNLLEEKYSEILLGTKRLQMMKNLDKNRVNMPICNQCEF